MKKLLFVLTLLVSFAAHADVDVATLTSNSLQVQEGNGIAGQSFPYPPSTISGVNRITLQTEAIKAGGIPQNAAQRFVLGIFTDWQTLPMISIINGVTDFTVFLWDGSGAFTATGPVTDAEGGLVCHLGVYGGHAVAYCPSIDGYLVL